MSRPSAITDHTTLHQRRSWTGRADSRAANVDPTPDVAQMTETDRRVTIAFQRALSDKKAHKVSDLMKLSDIRALLTELKVPHTKVPHLLKLLPAIFSTHVLQGNLVVWLNQKPPTSTNAGSTEAGSSRQGSRSVSVLVPSTRRNSGPTPAPSTAATFGSTSTPLFASSDDDDDRVQAVNKINHDSDSSSGDKDNSRRSQPVEPSRRQSESAWAIQRPQEHQLQSQRIANASTSPQKRDRFKRFGPRQSAPASTSASGSGRNESVATARTGGDSDDGEDLLRAIRESTAALPPPLMASRQEPEDISAVVPVRKQPAAPLTATAQPIHARQEFANNHESLFGPVDHDSDMQLDDLGNETLTASQFENGQSTYGEELGIETSRSQTVPKPELFSDDENDFDLQLDNTRRSASRRPHQRTSSGGGSGRKDVPDLLFDGFKATRSRGRSTKVGPPGMDEASTRDSSIQDGDSLPDEAELEQDKEEEDVKPVIQKRGPTKPGTVRPRRSDDSDDSDEDVVFVTSRRVGAPPEKTREEREAEREERRREREERDARRKIEKELEMEKQSRRKRRNPLPTYTKSSDAEASEIKRAYEVYLADLHKARLQAKENDVIDLDAEATPQNMPDLATITLENARWTQVFSYETPPNRGARPDFNTVKFWPYNLPFPGRLRDEAIVAVAGEGIVRVYRLSERRGVSELWNAVDESVAWTDHSDLKESFYTCAWTYDIRRDASIAPHWRKWPLLCLAGRGKEVKILDGYSGTTLKVIQGHGGAIHSMVVHPTLPHIIATASGDEVISLWDISVPTSRPEVSPEKAYVDEEQEKRRKGYAEGERLHIFGGFSGHVEAVLSIAIHPSLPLLVSGGGDCKLRIWRIPDDLPQHPTSSLTIPTPIDPPLKSKRPSTTAFPIFFQASLHSHHIDHVEFVGHKGHILTRSLCFDAPGKRIIRLLRPRFFDTLEDDLARPADVVGLDIHYSPDVELLAKWATPGASGAVASGLICTTVELACDIHGKLTSKRKVYMPSAEPAVHVYDLELAKQANIPGPREYPVVLGKEIMFDEDPKKNTPLRAIDCQPAGRGWLVAAGQGEKLMVWKRKDDEILRDKNEAMYQLLSELRIADGLPQVRRSPTPAGLPETLRTVNGNSLPSPASSVHSMQDRTMTAPHEPGHKPGDFNQEGFDNVDQQVPTVPLDSSVIQNPDPRLSNGQAALHAPQQFLPATSDSISIASVSAVHDAATLEDTLMMNRQEPEVQQDMQVHYPDSVRSLSVEYA